MPTKFLLPHRWRRPGWLLTVIFLFLGIGSQFLDLQFSALTIPASWLDKGDIFVRSTINLTHTVVGLGLLCGLLMVAFSRERQEDEYISRIRLESLLWAVFINYLLLAICMILFYGNNFLEVMIYNLFTVLIFFIARFNLTILRQNRQLRHAQ